LKGTDIEKLGRESKTGFLESHRQKMGKQIGEAGYSHMKVQISSTSPLGGRRQKEIITTNEH
jgi:hypothetical protein